MISSIVVFFSSKSKSESVIPKDLSLVWRSSLNHFFSANHGSPLAPYLFGSS